VAGHIYKHGVDDGLPCASANTKIPINLHIGAVVGAQVSAAHATRRANQHHMNKT